MSVHSNLLRECAGRVKAAAPTVTAPVLPIAPIHPTNRARLQVDSTTNRTTQCSRTTCAASGVLDSRGCSDANAVHSTATPNTSWSTWPALRARHTSGLVPNRVQDSNVLPTPRSSPRVHVLTAPCAGTLKPTPTHSTPHKHEKGPPPPPPRTHAPHQLTHTNSARYCTRRTLT